MVNNETGIEIEKQAVYVDESLIWTAGMGVKTAESTSSENYINIPALPDEKEATKLIVNIETTGIDPKTSRLISISYQPANKPEDNPVVLIYEDEQQILKEFFHYFTTNGFDTVIGYNVSFDFRFIFVRAMSYMIPCSAFFWAKLYDMMEVMKQVKTAFVYGSQTAYSLSEWGEFFFNYPKPFTDTQMQEYYETGDWDQVYEFADSQIRRTLALYLLAQYVISTSFVSGGMAVSGTGSSSKSSSPNTSLSKLTYPEAQSPKTKILKCPKCLAETEVPANTTSFVCPICKTIIKA